MELREPIDAQFAEFVKTVETDTSNELMLGKAAVWWKQHFAAITAGFRNKDLHGHL